MKRSGIMLAYPFEEKRLEKWGYPVITQPKLDGERCRAIVTNGNVRLLSSERNIFTSVPHINDELKTICAAKHIKNIEFDGELYNHDMNFSQIHSVVSRTKNPHPDYDKIQFHCFDLVDEQINQHCRLTDLYSILDLAWLKSNNYNYVKPVDCVVVGSFDQLMNRYEKYKQAGYEGIIVRHIDALYMRKRSIYMMKFKPKKIDIYTIVGFKEEHDKNGKPKNRLGALTCQANEGEHTFNVGSGLTESQRINLWKVRNDLIGQYCVVEYQHLTPAPKRLPRFPIFIKITRGLDDV